MWLDIALVVGIIVMVILVYRSRAPAHVHDCPTCRRAPHQTHERLEPERISLPFPGTPAAAPAPVDVELVDGLAACPPRDAYSILEISDFLAPELCDGLVASARGALVPSRVYAADQPFQELSVAQRVSEQAILHNGYTEAVAQLARELVGLDETHFEDAQVIRYAPNGMFDEHYDTNPSNKALPTATRVMTLMVYLNDCEGGETEFPRIGKRVRPQKGKAVLFWSARPTTRGNELIRESLHRGAPAGSEKWICNVWIHSAPFVVDARFQ
jgi:hypothetical protein